jgi:hypothetical protein
MKVLALISLFALVSCAHNRRPASLNGNPVAYDEMAFGNVRALAVKSVEQQDVCFDITLEMKGVNQKEVMSTNWTVAWVDKDSKYHLLALNQRDPASVPKGGTKIAPYGTYEEWSNSFRTCAPKTKMSDVKSLVLTPKELTYNEHEGMKLVWK